MNARKTGDHATSVTSDRLLEAVHKSAAAACNSMDQACGSESAQVFRNRLGRILQTLAMSLGGFVHVLSSQIEQTNDEVIRRMRLDLKLPRGRRILDSELKDAAPTPKRWPNERETGESGISKSPE